MQIKKVYREVNPGLLFDELRDLILKQDVALEETKQGTYSLPNDSSVFITRGLLTFKNAGENSKECIRADMVGSAKSETRLIIDIDDKLFPAGKIATLESDLDFIFGPYEKKD
jgi:hypothetical protein